MSNLALWEARWGLDWQQPWGLAGDWVRRVPVPISIPPRTRISNSENLKREMKTGVGLKRSKQSVSWRPETQRWESWGNKKRQACGIFSPTCESQGFQKEEEVWRRWVWWINNSGNFLRSGVCWVKGLRAYQVEFFKEKKTHTWYLLVIFPKSTD